MRNRSHPRLAVVLCLALACIASRAEPAEDPMPLPESESESRELVEMDPAHAAQAALAPVVEGPPGSVAIEIATPEEDAIFSEAPVAHLFGRLDALGQTGRVDAVVVIDTSASTARRAVRRDRVRERARGPYRPRQPTPSILDHEIRSAELLMEELDPRETRLGIVTFAGTEDGEPHDPARSAHTEVALTGRFEALDAGLQRVRARGAAGRTDMATALDLAVAELSGSGASRPDADAAKVVVFLTDGTPTLPHPETDANERTVFEAAERAAAAGVRIFSFAIGPEALRRPAAATEMARRTDGVYTPVRQPKQLAEAVTSTVEFERVGGELSVRNATLRANARDLHVSGAGVFGGIVPLRPGKNRIDVHAVAGRSRASATRIVHYAPGEVVVWNAPERRILPVPTVTTRRELEIGAGQRRSLEITLGGDAQRKEIQIGIGER